MNTLLIFTTKMASLDRQFWVAQFLNDY